MRSVWYPKCSPPTAAHLRLPYAEARWRSWTRAFRSRRRYAGIAMGLIKEGDKIAILSDIQGMEDFLGDMDFKVAGTEKGVTAIQMDIKIHGTFQRNPGRLR